MARTPAPLGPLYPVFFVGIRTLHTGRTRYEVMPVQKALADVLFRRIPAGLGSTGQIHLSRREMDRMLVEGARCAVAQGYGDERDLPRIEEQDL